jgi:hypothetical protein
VLDDGSIRMNAVHQTALLSPFRVDEISGQEDLEDGGRSEESHEWLEFLVRHRKPEAIDRGTKKAGLTANAKIATCRDFKASSDAQSFDERDGGVPAHPNRIHGSGDCVRVGPYVLRSGTLRIKSSDVRTSRKRLPSSAPNRNAPHLVNRRDLTKSGGDSYPTVDVKNIVPFRTIEPNGRDRRVDLDVNESTHR